MSSKPDDEPNYDLVKRKRVETESVVKSLLQALGSHVGLVVLCVAVAVLGRINFIFTRNLIKNFIITTGAEAYIELELPFEEKEYADKRKAGKSVDEAQRYLSEKFFDYATNEDTYNFTEEM